MAYAANAGGVGTLEDVDDEEELETIASSGRGSGTGRQHLKDWWKPVLEMPFSDPEQDAPYWVNTNNVALRTPYPGILIKAFALIDSSRIQVYVAGTRRDNVRAIEDQLRMHREALLRELPPGTEIVPGEDWPIRTGKTELQDDAERRDWIISTLNTYANALRPRLRDWYADSRN